MRVFLLEDEYALNKSITRLLKLKGYEVDSCLDGDEAMELIPKNHYNIFIIDINLPGTNGLEVLTAVKRDHPDVPVVMISSNLDILSITDAYNRGCDEYLKKPFHIRELEIKIERLMEKSATQQPLTEQLTYHIDSRMLYRGEELISLTKKESRLLDLLVRNIGKTVEFEEIEKGLWGDKMTRKLFL